VIIDHINYN